MTRPGVRRLGTLVAWICALSAVAAALWVSGRGALAAPALLDPGTWGAWLREREPVVAVFAIARLGALGAVAYLSATTALGVTARLLRARPLVALADSFTVPAVRRLLQGALGLSLVATPVTTTWRIPAFAGPGVAVVATVADGEAHYETATMRRLPDPATATPTETPTTVAAEAVATRVETPATADTTADTTWTVRPGDHFWAIAGTTLATTWGRAPSDKEIVPYWSALIEANRATLVDPTDPDLIRPGQRFRLPPPPSPGP